MSAAARADLPAPKPVRVWRNVTRERFEQDIQPLHVPALLKGLVRHWPVVREAQRSEAALCRYVCGFSKEKPVQSFHGAAAMKGRFFYNATMDGFNFERRMEPLGALLTRLLEHLDDPQPPYCYAGAVNVPEHVPDFAAAHPMELLARDMEQLVSVWIGNRTQIPIHWDLAQNLACVVAGRRRFKLFPVSQMGNLYMGPLDFTLAGQPCSLVDPLKPDLDRFPRYAKAAATAQIAELEPGDALYLPAMWLHHVQSLDGLGMLVNFWWRDGPAYMVTPLYTLLHALLTLRDMPEDERQSWRVLFDHYIFTSDTDTLAHIPEHALGALGEMTPERIGALREVLARQLTGQ